jgi:hypothetical protein
MATAAVVLAAVVVGGAALADSVKKWAHDSNAEPAKHVTVRDVQLARRVAVAARLRAAGVDGILYFVDGRCRLHALRLPSLASAPVPRNGGCRALISPAPAPPGWSLWPRNTPLAARCERHRVIVSPSAGPALPMIGGCAPAWRPDGAISYIRRGSIVQFPRTGRAEVVRSRDQLANALERRLGPGAWRVGSVAWLGPTRFAVVAVAASRRALVVFSGRRITAINSKIPATVTELRASPRGAHVVLRTPHGLYLYDVGQKRLRRLRGADAIAWSRNGAWVATGNPERVVFRRGSTRIALPLGVVDLGWTRTD